MCPICITTGTLIATGATSAGGLTALAARVLRARSKARLRETPAAAAQSGPQVRPFPLPQPPIR
jgi:hypothetical protein